MKNHFINALSAIAVPLLFAVAPVYCQIGETKAIKWETKLFENSVDYGSYACDDTEKETVNEFFKTSPLSSSYIGKRGYSICHNNCAVLVDFPSRPLTYLDDKIKGNGFVAIHILVDEKGRPIFSRSLNGHPVIRSIMEKRGCQATFKTSETKRHKVIFFCIGDKCEEPQPVL